MKLYGYTRVSHDSQREGQSIDAQVEAIKRYCEDSGNELVGILSDEGVSGFTEKRKGFRRLILALEDKKAEGVVVYKLDRLSRNLSALLAYLERFKEEGWAFISIVEKFDTTTAIGKAFFQLIGTFAEMERNMVSDRVKMVYRYKFDSGLFVGRAAYGYKIRTVGRRSRVSLDEPKASNVRTIFRLACEGFGVDNIEVKTGMHHYTITNIIRNKLYAGIIEYPKLFPNEVRKASFEPLVSYEDWLLANQVLAKFERKGKGKFNKLIVEKGLVRKEKKESY